MNDKPPFKTRIGAALKCLQGRPVVYHTIASIDFTDFEMAVMADRGAVCFIASKLQVTAPAGTMCRAEDGSLWVVPKDGVLHHEPDGNYCLPGSS